MRRLWLVFAQAVTVSLAVLFVVLTLKPEWLNRSALTPVAVQPAVTTVTAPPISVANKGAASYADAAQHALPSVVQIFTSKETRVQRNPLLNDPVFRHFFGDQLDGEQSGRTQRQLGLGSGVIVSEEGYILTNNHVIEAADEIEIATNDGKKYLATVIGTDPESDLAVLRAQGKQKLPVMTFAREDSVRVGDVVLAIGNPFGVGQTVTMGIVSATGRNHLGINTFENFIQTDAAINPGNSGGALVDVNGNLVGINTAIYSRTPGGASLGIGYAIPTSIARNIMEQIIKTGSVTRGWIGVEVQEMTPEQAETFGLNETQGALIAGVIRHSPAEAAGIKPGDILLSINNKPQQDATAMRETIAGLQPGQHVQMRVQRQRKQLDLELEVGKRPPLKMNQRK